MGRGAAGGPGDEEEGTRSILGWAPPCACSDALSKSKTTNTQRCIFIAVFTLGQDGWVFQQIEGPKYQSREMLQEGPVVQQKGQGLPLKTWM